MTSTRSLLSLSLSLSLASVLTGCPGENPTDTGDDDAGPGTDTNGEMVDTGTPPRDAPIPDVLPPFRTPRPEIADAELAQMALRIMGSTDAGATRTLCNDCHVLTRAQIRYWRVLSDAALSDCLSDLTLAGGDAAAAEFVSCARGGDSRYNAHHLGIFATAGDLGWMRYAFAHGAAPGEHDTFLAQAAMPRDYDSLTQDEFDIVAEWFIRGVPGLDSIIPAETLPTTCEPLVTDSLVDYITERSTNSWTTANETAGMLMYGCAGAASPADCLADETLASSTGFGADWDDISSNGVPGARNRVLYTASYGSAYWTRSSSDGRFVSHGAGSSPNLRFIDLAGGGSGPLTGRVIGGDANYDPFFFPDDSGFMIQGGPSGDHVCEMSVLTTGSPTMLTFREAGCNGAGGVDLYEHLGAALSGGDYWAIDSVGAGMFATYDNGGQDATLDNPSVGTFSTAMARSTVRFLVNTGTEFDAVASARINHPYEGDAVISPAVGLLLTRQAGESGQLGFTIRTLAVTGTGATRSIESVVQGRYCTLPGGKPGFSYDERFFAFHHYVENTNADAMELGFTGTSDPGFAGYRTRGAANVYMVDMATGDVYRITNMAPGQYALFPHFRSDGWMYMMVRTEGEVPEHVVANDAALRIDPL